MATNLTPVMSDKQPFNNVVGSHVTALHEMLLSPDKKKAEGARKALAQLGFSVKENGSGGFSIAKAAGRPFGDDPKMDRAAVFSNAALSTASGTPAVEDAVVDNTPPSGRRPPAPAATPPAAPETAAPAAPAPTGPKLSPLAPAAPTNAYAMGAPALNDRSDAFGRPIAGAQTFVRGLFATADNANKALTEYKKQNPNSTADTDPQHQQLQQAVNNATSQATAGSQWAAMPQSARQSALTQGEVAAGKARAINQTQQAGLEQRNAETEREHSGIETSLPKSGAFYNVNDERAKRRGALETNLLEDGAYYAQTGVMRGGAGVGTSTTRAGGVISTDSTTGGKVLESPYGKGSSVALTADQMKKRPEAIMDGVKASEFFDKSAMRQGTTFDVGDKHYSPELSPADYKQQQLDEAKRKAEEEKKKFAQQLLKK